MLEFLSPRKTIRKKRKPRPRKTCAHSLLPSRAKGCTGLARRPGSPGDCLLCAPCFKWAQGKQTDQQVDAALHMRTYRRLKKKSAGGKDSQSNKESSNGAYVHTNKFVDLQLKQSATPSKKSSPDLEVPPTNKIFGQSKTSPAFTERQKSKESIESGESEDEEKEEEVTQSPNNS